MTRSCRSSVHFSRRDFLRGATTGALGLAGFGAMAGSDGAKSLQRAKKQVVVFWMTGGVSQLETWDPKPDTDTGGPFQAIPTSVPGVHISELLPYTAKVMHHLALVRGINTKENNHAKGKYIMQTGHRQTPGFDYPWLGPAMASQLSRKDNPLPPNCMLMSKTDYNVDAKLPLESSFLGAEYTAVPLRGGVPPKNLALPDGVTDAGDVRRRALRQKISSRFSDGRHSKNSRLYDSSFDRGKAIMQNAELFDFDKLPAKDQVRYGKQPFGRDCLMARRLLEAGVTFVMVRHTDYDSHSENFNGHLEQLGEWDQPFSTFVTDLADRGMLKHTLIIVMCEFGRTPKINRRVGRDHWGTAWSIALGGSGVKAGAVVGKTNKNGTKVIDREVNGGHLFHTYYRAVGLDPTDPFLHEGRPFHKADPKVKAIHEILS